MTFKVIDKVLTIFEDTVLVFGLLSTTFILFINVLLRYIFKSGIVWAEEYSRYAIIWIVCSGCGAAVRKDMHMRITAILDISKNKKFNFILNTIVIIIGIIFGVFLVFYGSKLVASMISNNQLSPAMEIPLWWIYISIPIGGFLMVVRYIQSLSRLISAQKNERGEVE